MYFVFLDDETSPIIWFLEILLYWFVLLTDLLFYNVGFVYLVRMFYDVQ